MGAALLVATVFVHGALAASIGLALATWIQRQSRAIATSVAIAVMVSAGWPLLVVASRVGMAGQGLSCLSPLVAALNLAETLTMRYFHFRGYFWWIAFWNIECAVVAFGLLWLTVRTFDRCFGRIPGQPRQTPVLSDVILVLAAALSAGGLFGAITLWIRGLGADRLDATAILPCGFLLTVGFLLLSALAPLSIFRRNAPHLQAVEAATVVLDRSTFTRRWWESYRLVLLLAIGPALFALALATARMPIRVIPKTTTLAGGVTEKIATFGNGTTYVTTTDAAGVDTIRFATDQEIAAATAMRPSPARSRFLGAAVLAVFTILVHGAAYVSLGLALGLWMKSRARAIAGSVCVFLCVTIGWPIACLLAASSRLPWGATLVSFPGSFICLLVNMSLDEVLTETVRWASWWNAFFIVLSAVIVKLTLWTLDRRSGVQPTERRHLEFAHTAETPFSASSAQEAACDTASRRKIGKSIAETES